MKQKNGNFKHSKVIFFSLLNILMLIPSLLITQGTDQSKFSQTVNHFFEESIAETTPGAAVVVTVKGIPIFKKCYGLANLEHNVPVTLNTKFNLASVAKQFTAFSILLLENEGKINLDDDIRKYLPELPGYNHTVTVQHLLNHTSGIWEYSAIMSSYAGYSSYDYYTQDEVFRLLKNQKKLLFEPGSQWSYCNTNYLLLAQIVAKITEEPFFTWTREHIFQPLGMKNSLFHENSFQVIKERATPYRKNKQGEFINGYSNRNNYSGMAYLFTTIDDMTRWMDNFRTKKLGGKSVVDKMFQKGKLNNGSESYYGNGLGVLEMHGKKVIHHSGQTGGYKAQMLYCPENEVGITILANERSFNAERMTNQIFGFYLGIEPEIKKAKNQAGKKLYVAIDSLRLNDFAGTFLIEKELSKLAFCSLGNNKFFGIFEGLGQDYFYPVTDTKFVTFLGDVSIEFFSEKNENLNRIKLDLKGDIMWADRIDFKRSDPSQLNIKYAGAYYSSILGTVFEIHTDEHNIIMRHRRYEDRTFQQVADDSFASAYGIIRFKKDEQGNIEGFDILDETFNYEPVSFRRIED